MRRPLGSPKDGPLTNGSTASVQNDIQHCTINGLERAAASEYITIVAPGSSTVIQAVMKSIFVEIYSKSK